jgi:hypothetical protein
MDKPSPGRPPGRVRRQHPLRSHHPAHASAGPRPGHRRSSRRPDSRKPTLLQREGYAPLDAPHAPPAPPATAEAESHRPPSKAPPRVRSSGPSWSDLLKRCFDTDGGACVRCAGRMKLRAIVIGTPEVLADAAYHRKAEDRTKLRTGVPVEIVRRRADTSTDGWMPNDEEAHAVQAGSRVLRQRWIVERSHAWTTRSRSLARGFEWTAAVSAAWQELAYHHTYSAKAAPGCSPRNTLPRWLSGRFRRGAPARDPKGACREHRTEGC